jgi:hypothetical protein
MINKKTHSGYKCALMVCLSTLLMVSCCSNEAGLSEQTNIINRIQEDPNPDFRFFMNVLQEEGHKLGCHFTLESLNYDITTGKESKADLPVREDLSAGSITEFVVKLRAYLGDFIVEPDSKNPKIVHIIEKALADDNDYPLNKVISLNYKGKINGTNIDNPEGSSTMSGGLVPALAEKAGFMMWGTVDDPRMSTYYDLSTVVTVTATNKTVRSILTDCLPTKNYNPVMWRAMKTLSMGRPCVLVQFSGPNR